MAKIAVSRFRWVGSTLYAILLAALPLLTGCGHDRAKFQNDLMSWSGQREVTLVTAWGPPDRFHELERTRFLAYDKGGRTVYILPPTSALPNGVSSRTRFRSLNCTVTFVIAEGIVQSWSYHGQNCR